MKKLFSVCLCLTMWLSAFGYEFCVDGVFYNVIDDNQVEVTCYSSFGFYYGDVTIPSSVIYDTETYDVVSIGWYAFYDCVGLTSVTFPNSLTYIGKYAFYNCSSLTSVTIPNSVTSIDQYAFYGCGSLTSVTIPKIAMPLSSYFPNSPIANVTIADGADSIFSNAFYGFNLTSVAFPSSVTYIESGTLNGFGNLLYLTVDANNTKYNSRYNCNAIIETATNKLLFGSNNTIIPNGVTSIEANAFSGFNGLTSVAIPSSVTSIGSGAFSGCNNLTSVTIPDGVPSIENSTFYNCSSLTSVTIPNSVTSIGSSAFYGCSGLTSVTIPNGVTTIYEYAFKSCDKLVTVSIPNSVISIGDHAFSVCRNLAVINCYATIPPAIRESTFDKYDATLYVPANSVELYQSRDYWKNFFIMPMQEDGLEYSLADRNVDYLNGRIYNENGLEIKLYDASGRLVTSGDGDIDMSNCPNGIYLVTDGKGGSLKIVHRK